MLKAMPFGKLKGKKGTFCFSVSFLCHSVTRQRRDRHSPRPEPVPFLCPKARERSADQQATSFRAVRLSSVLFGHTHFDYRACNLDVALLVGASSFSLATQRPSLVHRPRAMDGFQIMFRIVAVDVVDGLGDFVRR